ncbi:VapA/VapB family virulence-associated protein [Hymenobacter busanensis]|uniref:VapA/VapB family virulence-associated protein n=2 Tax=Hymenobacter busanensis TaxID=2607656 RepID=A0A7L5A1N8_9BACT|nr:VapA/VapB family virulence-associated protein [Hymenobacter busanensis]QHJ09704.1 VapA/VapB family virulence-associated protein [Hymenobacter busanensis]
MARSSSINKEQVAEDFRAAMEGVLEPEDLNAAVHTILTTTKHYPAKGNVVSLAFYMQFQVYIDGGKTFNGKGGALSSPGAGALYGAVYTSDLDRLYRDTTSIQFNVAEEYTNINFFDRFSNLLGSFHSGSVSTVNGIGGGTGSWQ